MKVFIKKIITKIAYWVLPEGIINFIKSIKLKIDYYGIEGRLLLRPNVKFKDIHKGERCFIICNGPSINKQNLLLLKDEIVFSTAWGFFHKDYLAIQPKYHCLAQITCHKNMNKENVIKIFKEMDSKLGTAELFLSLTEKPLVREYSLFPRRKVNYAYFGYEFIKNHAKIIDISKIIPRAISVPIICLMIAMYMGFKRIYLLGVEHDSFMTGEYRHFYTSTLVKDGGVDSNYRLTISPYEEFQYYVKLWEQYKAIHDIAQANNIEIFNATIGGALYEFERVNLKNLFYNKT